MAFFAAADGNVVGHATVGIKAASSGTRIDAFVVDAALIPRAVGIKDALRPAGAVRIANVIGRADAINGAVLFLALRICSARIGIAGSWWLNHVRLN